MRSTSSKASSTMRGNRSASGPYASMAYSHAMEMRLASCRARCWGGTAAACGNNAVASHKATNVDARSGVATTELVQCLSSLLQHFAKASGDDLLLARSHHPDSDDEGVALGTGSDGGRSGSQAVDCVGRRDPFCRCVPRDPNVRNMVGDLGYEDVGFDAGQGCHAAANHLGAHFEVTLFRRMIFRQVQLQRRQHAEHLFLVDFHSASDGVAVRGRVQARRSDEIPPAEEQAGTLRAAETLAARERDEVETHLRVLPQVGGGRYVGGGVVQGGNSVLPSEPDELFVLDPPFRVVVVVEKHHRGLLVDGAFQVVSRLYLHEPHTAVADGMVVTEAMGFLNDDLALHAGEVGEIE